MEPAFGCTRPSPEAIRRAEARLREDTQGVRDEVGFEKRIAQPSLLNRDPGEESAGGKVRFAIICRLGPASQRIPEMPRAKNRMRPGSNAGHAENSSGRTLL